MSALPYFTRRASVVGRHGGGEPLLHVDEEDGGRLGSSLIGCHGLRQDRGSSVWARSRFAGSANVAASDRVPGRPGRRGRLGVDGHVHAVHASRRRRRARGRGRGRRGRRRARPRRRAPPPPGRSGWARAGWRRRAPRRTWPAAGTRICPQAASFPTTTTMGSLKRTAVSKSMPFRPKAPSPWMTQTGRSGARSLAAMAKGAPTPRQPSGPGSSQRPGPPHAQHLGGHRHHVPAVAHVGHVAGPRGHRVERAGQAEVVDGPLVALLVDALLLGAAPSSRSRRNAAPGRGAGPEPARRRRAPSSTLRASPTMPTSMGRFRPISAASHVHLDDPRAGARRWARCRSRRGSRAACRPPAPRRPAPAPPCASPGRTTGGRAGGSRAPCRSGRRGCRSRVGQAPERARPRRPTRSTSRASSTGRSARAEQRERPRSSLRGIAGRARVGAVAAPAPRPAPRRRRWRARPRGARGRPARAARRAPRGRPSPGSSGRARGRGPGPTTW